MTRRMEKMIEKAKAAGFTVAAQGSSTVVYKEVGRWKKKEGVYIYAGGAMFQIGVELCVARCMTYKQAYAVLGVEE
jgi:hypothetical protein